MTDLSQNSSYYKFQERQTNMEYLRIFAMFLIVLSHMQLYLEAPTLENLKYNFTDFVMRLFLACGRIGTNAFVLLTGYFSIKSCFKLSSLMKLWCITVFYSVLLMIVFKFSLDEPFNLKETLSYFLPISFNKYWFVSTYFCLYLISPFLIKGINNLNQKQHFLLICVLLFFFSFWPTVLIYPEYAYGMNYHLLFWFMIVFITGSYFKLYVDNDKINIKKCMFFILGLICTYMGYLCLADYASDRLYLYLERNNLFFVAIALLLFCIFKKIKSTPNKYINSISVCMIGVYLLHVHPIGINFIKKYLPISIWDKYCILKCLLAAIVIFLVCIAIEYLRRILSRPLSCKMIDALKPYDEKIKQIIQEKN